MTSRGGSFSSYRAFDWTTVLILSEKSAQIVHLGKLVTGGVPLKRQLCTLSTFKRCIGPRCSTEKPLGTTMKLLAVNKMQRYSYSLKVQLLHIALRTDMLKMTAQFGSLNLLNVNFVYV